MRQPQIQNGTFQGANSKRQTGRVCPKRKQDPIPHANPKQNIPRCKFKMKIGSVYPKRKQDSIPQVNPKRRQSCIEPAKP
jgi:hypothetical protein